MGIRRGRHVRQSTVARRWGVAVICAAVVGAMAAGAAASPDVPDGHLTPGVAHQGAGFHTHANADGEEDVNVCSDAVAPGTAH